MEIDHVVLHVDDLEAAAERMLGQHGLAAVAGGRHPGHGTGNRLVPLGDAYLELMAVVDAAEATSSPMGRWALTGARWPPAAAAICMRPADLNSVAHRLGLEPVLGSRVRPDGSMLAWRTVGLEGVTAAGPPLFFIEWLVADDDHPGRQPASHLLEPTGTVEATVTGDGEAIAALLGGDVPSVTVADGAPSVEVTVHAKGGAVTL